MNLGRHTGLQGAEDDRRLVGPGQRARVDLKGSHSLKALSDKPRLATPFFAQRNVAPPLEPGLSVPLRHAVADEVYPLLHHGDSPSPHVLHE